MHDCMPLDEIEALHEINCFEADVVENWDGVASINAEEEGDNTTDVAQILTMHYIPVIIPRPLMVDFVTL
jgi:hypothetical protein